MVAAPGTKEYDMKIIEMTEAQRKAAADLAKELPHAAKIRKCREDLKPLVDKGVFDNGYTDPETGLVFSVKISRSLTVEGAA